MFGMALLMIAAIGGCASGRTGTVIEARRLVGPPPNLALGPTAEHARLGCLLTERADWPAAEIGYQHEEVTFYSKITYDEQSYFDRFGAVYHQTQSFQTGMRVR